MKISILALTALLSAAWAASPLLARANDDNDDGDRVVVEKEVRGERIGGREREGGDREGGGMRERRERPEGREGREGGMREGRGGPMGGPGQDPEMKEKFEKMRDLEKKLHEVARKIAQSADAEKAAAKADARKIIGELFDAKLAMETSMLAKMEKHMADLKAKIAKKKSGREKMIDSKLARISGEGDDWD